MGRKVIEPAKADQGLGGTTYRTTLLTMSTIVHVPYSPTLCRGALTCVGSCKNPGSVLLTLSCRGKILHCRGMTLPWEAASAAGGGAVVESKFPT